MEILFLLFLFQIKHWFADFKIQTYMQTVKKGVWLDPIGLSHSIDHVVISAIALMIFCAFIPLPLHKILIVLALEGPAHYLIDFIKVRYGCKDNTKPLFWSQFGQDQLAHQVCYIAIAAYLLPI